MDSVPLVSVNLVECQSNDHYQPVLYDRQDLLRKLRNSRTQYVVVTYTAVLGKVIQAFCDLGNVMVKVHDKEDGVFPRLASWRWGNEI